MRRRSYRIYRKNTRKNNSKKTMKFRGHRGG
jgi:hypothetical protein